MILFVLLVLLAYALGAIPFALLIGKVNGVDIRAVGSGNVGATNVYRSLGKGWGILTFICDATKGWIPAFLFPLALVGDFHPGNSGLIFGCAAIAGHNWPIYLRFKGGKGVATSAGVLLGVAPPAMGVGLVTWVLILAVTRYVSLASIGAAIAIPLAGWWWYGTDNLVLALVLTLLGALVVVRHWTNIKRLLAGTEHRFGRRSNAQ